MRLTGFVDVPQLLLKAFRVWLFRSRAIGTRLEWALSSVLFSRICRFEFNGSQGWG